MKTAKLILALAVICGLSACAGIAEDTDKMLAEAVERLQCMPDFFDNAVCYKYLMDEWSCEEMRQYLESTVYDENGSLISDYKTIQESGLEAVDAVTVKGGVFWNGKTENPYHDEYILELYAASNGDYLVTARRGEIIYCAQYVNSDDSVEYFENAVPDENVFAIERQINDSSYWYGVKYSDAFFLDGTCVELMDMFDGYGPPDGHYYHDTYMLIRFFDVCAGKKISY